MPGEALYISERYGFLGQLFAFLDQSFRTFIASRGAVVGAGLISLNKTFKAKVVQIPGQILIRRKVSKNKKELEEHFVKQQERFTDLV